MIDWLIAQMFDSDEDSGDFIFSINLVTAVKAVKALQQSESTLNKIVM
jgi:hypothetical protein